MRGRRITDEPIENTVLRHVHACRRLWNEFLGLWGAKHYAATHGERERVEALDARMATVSLDLTAAEAALARADYVEAHPPDWRAQPWAKAALVVLVLLPGVAWAQQPVTPTQRGYIQNQTLRSTTISPASFTIAAVPNQRVRLYGFVASCTSGSASMLVLDGSTIVYNTDASFVSANAKDVRFPVPITGGLGNSMFISLGSCRDGGSIGQLTIQADQWGP